MAKHEEAWNELPEPRDEPPPADAIRKSIAECRTAMERASDPSASV